MYASKTGELVVLTPPRTASRSVRDCLLEKGWLELNGHHGIDASACRGARRVAVLVRNHWDAMVSWHVNLSEVRSTGLPFEAWLGTVVEGRSSINTYRANGWSGVSRGSLWSPWLIWADQCIYFERLEEDLGDFLTPLQVLEQGELQHVRDSPVRPRPTVLEAYSSKARALVQDYFDGEIQALGYEFPIEDD